MSKISIREQRNQSQSDGFCVVISFDGADEFDGLTVHNPLTPQSREKLEWHFEQYVNSPYLKTVESSEAEKIICEEGENLFSQLFSQPQIYNRYQQTIRDGLKIWLLKFPVRPNFTVCIGKP